MRIHNISDRPNTNCEPRALIIGRQKIRPGQYAEIEDAFINDKVRALHGTVLWLGDQLPLSLRRTSRAGLEAQQRDLSPAANPAMSIQEARSYLATLSEAELVELCGEVIPPLVFPNSPPKDVLVSRLGRALFTPGRVLNPQQFFWLRRWVRKGETYLERE
jgi:hypothetical protein